MPDMNPPEQIKPTKLADYLDVMSKAAFQSGISWRVVEAKWAGSREVFRDFDPQKLVELTPDEVDAMATDTRIIRNRRKVDATIHNAQAMLYLDRAAARCPRRPCRRRTPGRTARPRWRRRRRVGPRRFRQ